MGGELSHHLANGAVDGQTEAWTASMPPCDNLLKLHLQVRWVDTRAVMLVYQ